MNNYLDIKGYLNTTKEEINSDKFNIFIAVCVGNKYFSEENLRKYILWALGQTKKDIAILVADGIHAINYEVKNKYKKEKALRTALRNGMKIKEAIENIINKLDTNKKNQIKIVRWEDIENQNNYIYIRDILHSEFKNNPAFYERIMKIVKENVQITSSDICPSDYEKLALYPLGELPVLINGFEYQGKFYNLLPYPGLSEGDYLALDLQEGVSFPDITKKINPTNKVALVEAYTI